MWVALDEATLKNGALHFIPGSFKDAELGRTAGGFGDMNKIFEDYPEWIDRSSDVIELPAGGASFHSGMIAHAAGPNMTPGRRRAMTCAYMPDGSSASKRGLFVSDSLPLCSVSTGSDRPAQLTKRRTWVRQRTTASRTCSQVRSSRRCRLGTL